MKVVDPINSSATLCIADHDLPFPQIFCGPVNHPNRHGAIHVYSYTHDQRDKR